MEKLKINKSNGPDEIINEILLYGIDAFVAPISKLFNIILNSNSFPALWQEGHLTSIYKSGETDNPENYRGITIQSCLGKLFTATLKDRLQTYLDDHNLLNKYQAGFRPGYRTSDQSFILKTLVKKYICQHKKKLYVCFVDFRKAFDLIWHNGLQLKMLELGIGGKLYDIIKNMYNNLSIKVKTSKGLSYLIKCYNGLRQGDGISPLLFNIYTNDLPTIFQSSECHPPVLHNQSVPCLMYADDLIILSETKSGLQNGLDRLNSYCQKWHMNVNLTKTKIIIMNPGNKPQTARFFLDNTEIERTKSYKYLGTIINSKGTFALAKEDLKNKGLKALFSLWRSISTEKIPRLKIATIKTRLPSKTYFNI